MVGWALILVAFGIMFTTTRSRGLPREAKSKFIAFTLVALIVGVLLLYKSYNWAGTFWGDQTDALGIVEASDSTRNASPKADVFYGVMFDAGSTGSRVHAMKFASTGKGKPFKFIDVRFVQMKPGLSSFAKDPEKGAQSLVSLLEQAMAYIPKEHHKSTPIALKATAGLRLLPEAESKALLEHVRELFKKYPFRVFSDSVGIMGGTDEGIFSWFTLNFFLETMQDMDQTMGVMDLGGGSTQVTFVPRDQLTLKEAQAGSLTDIDIFGAKHKLYSHSYLGLGLMSARLTILGGHEGDGGGTLKSVCFTPGQETNWTHTGKIYTVKGLPNSGNRFDECYKASLNLIRGKVQHIKEIENEHFCTISYYYDMAVDYGLIDKGNEGKNLTVEHYFEAARTECQKPHPEHPFLCLDMTYMSALLHEGFGFRKDTKLMVIKRVRGREISWALGAMFNFFNNHHVRKR